MGKVYLGLVIHAHQPVGNFDHIIEDAYQKSYARFVRLIEAHPSIRLALHFSGCLLEKLEMTHPEFFEALRGLLARGQIELLGGGFYEPILPAIPDADKVAQIRRLRDYLHAHFSTEARGAWIAERVWEPSLAAPLHEAGAEYAILDDTHFLAAGLGLQQLRGAYVTESLGASLRLVPSLKSLRYTIPFREPAATLAVLREGLGDEDALFAMGDDCEKFGVWPGTYEHCYTNGWLEHFLSALEGESAWLETIRLSDYLAAHKPLGRIYLPTASYPEMMEWALPLATGREFHHCQEQLSGSSCSAFFRGGLWQNFFAKYSESNQIQKLALEVSRRWHAAKAAGSGPSEWLAQAQTHLLAGQCNDPYWHGVFGGLYAPHLRSAVLRHLIQAESLLDKIESNPHSAKPRVSHRDVDADGADETLIEHPGFALVVKPDDGGTVSSLRFKPADAELVNSLMRRPEIYHDRIREHADAKQSASQPASIHDRVWSKEAHLEALLRYDRYSRHGWRSYIFSATKQWQDFAELRLGEVEALSGAAWEIVESAKDGATIAMGKPWIVASRTREWRCEAVKSLSAVFENGALKLGCATRLRSNFLPPEPLAYGLELVFNLLAPDAPDRYFEAPGLRHPLHFKGEILSTELSLVDEWQRVRIRLTAEPHAAWWVTPIETISQSEAGFERVYQGSAILAVWRIPPERWAEIRFTVKTTVESLSK